MIALLTDIVLILTGFLLLLLAAVLLRQREGTRLNRNLLVAFLLTKAFLILRWFSFRFDLLAFERVPLIYYLSASAFFLLTPLLYLYVTSLCYKDFVLRKSDFLHGILFAVIASLLTLSVLAQTGRIGFGIGFIERVLSRSIWQLFWTLNFIQILAYIVAMMRAVRHYRRELQCNYSAIEKFDLKWLMYLLALIVLHWIFVVARAFLSLLHLTPVTVLAVIDLYSISIFLVFVTLLVIKGLSQVKIFTGLEHDQKYANSRLPENELQKYLHQLTELMDSEKPYLTPSLTIKDLSNQLAVPAWQLSQVINESFNKNFFNFVNSYRIEEAKRLMSERSDEKKTILEIVYEVGFNSKSTFNEVFKKYTRMTPTEFRRHHQNSN